VAVPGPGPTWHASEGEIGEAAIALAGDALMVVSFGASKGIALVRGGKVILSADAAHKIAIGGEASIGLLRLYQAAELAESGGERAAYLGEALLRLLTAGRGYQKLRLSGCKLKIPQGLTDEQFKAMTRIIREKAGRYGDNIVVQGSRAAGTAKATSDIDIAIRVTQDEFDAIIAARFGKPNPGSAKSKTMDHAIKTGTIQAGEAGLSGARREVEDGLGIPVDISIIRIGGPFDNGPTIPLPQ